ncbi:MAG: sugar ABC transporter permease [Oscillospiraceae bacterium]|jgi:multiple sugar transport system permease protein|nr:sugar ABC transporter permease [Oscillospiraceae bacterium]
MTASPSLTKPKRTGFRAEWLWAYALVLPTVVGLCVLNIYPFFQSIYTSLLRWQGLGAAKFVGLKNYQKLFSSKELGYMTLNTLGYMVLTVPIGVFLALVLGAMLNTKRLRGRDIYRGIFFQPMVVAPAAIAMVWRWIYNTDVGILNYALRLIGIPGVNWLSNPNWALIAVAIIGVWSAVGYDVVLILAGLQAIPETYYEASEIDGASRVRQFFHITVPLISPTLFFVVLMRMIGSIRQFDTIYMLIKPENPAYKSAATLMVWFYREAFEKFDKGYGSAIMIWSVLIIGAFTLIQFVSEKKLVHYD